MRWCSFQKMVQKLFSKLLNVMEYEAVPQVTGYVNATVVRSMSDCTPPTLLPT